MLTNLDDTCADLVRTLQRYSAFSSCHLVLRILVTWGYAMVDAGHFNTPRDVGTAFITAFDVGSSIDDDQSSHIGETSDQLGLTEYDFIASRFASALIGHPFEDALKAFIDAIHEWIRSASFNYSMESSALTREEVIRDMHKVWFYNIW